RRLVRLPQRRRDQDPLLGAGDGARQHLRLAALRGAGDGAGAAGDRHRPGAGGLHPRRRRLADLQENHPALGPLGRRLRRRPHHRAGARRVRRGDDRLRLDQRPDADAAAVRREAVRQLQLNRRLRRLPGAGAPRAHHLVRNEPAETKGGRLMGISVEGANKRFGDFQALNDVSIEVPDGSLTALLGPSGSGKSTLLRAIAGLEDLDSGLVTINGEDATAKPAQKRGVGFVFQHYAAFKHMTVYDNVAFGLKIRKWKKPETSKRVHELLQLVQLDGLAGRFPSQLSGGQRQRMALARALAVEPQVLLLDEPFGALDAKVRKDLRTWLRRLHEEMHATTIFVTHDQEEAMDVAGQLVVMNEGRVEQSGSADELYEHPANEFVM